MGFATKIQILAVAGLLAISLVSSARASSFFAQDRESEIFEMVNGPDGDEPARSILELEVSFITKTKIGVPVIAGRVQQVFRGSHRANDLVAFCLPGEREVLSRSGKRVVQKVLGAYRPNRPGDELVVLSKGSPYKVRSEQNIEQELNALSCVDFVWNVFVVNENKAAFAGHRGIYRVASRAAFASSDREFTSDDLRNAIIRAIR